MSPCPALTLCAFPLLSAVLQASDRRPAGVPLSRESAIRNEDGAPALFSWGDVEGDGRLDLAAVSAEGRLQLLASTGDGRFEDVTERCGLSGVANATLAMWADYDADGMPDLFVGARSGASRLFHNEGGTFVDMASGSGLTLEGPVQSAQWIDHDGDRRLDLFAFTAEGGALFRGLEGGFFEREALPVTGPGCLPEPLGPPVVLADAGTQGVAAREREKEGGDGRDSPPIGAEWPPGASPAGARGFTSSRPDGGGIAPIGPFDSGCVTSIEDQGNPASCLQASTTPTLGRLYPISSSLFVALSGDVGIGTTSPTARLHVEGTARIENTLTLSPAGDTALDVNTGSIYESGLLFIHTKGSAGNTALGREALKNIGFSIFAEDNTAVGYHALIANTLGGDNTACGSFALASNTYGYFNTACGKSALASNTSGYENTAIGALALSANDDGRFNTAVGNLALHSNTSGDYNTASGRTALHSNTSGSSNTAHGESALFANTTGARNTALGTGSLEYSSTADDNTALGFNALRAGTSGARNTASGGSALRSNTSGTRNTASGYGALRSNNTGSFNVADGEGALRLNTSGSANTAAGLSALYANTSGSHNTANGYWALRYSTGNDNTACGDFALRSNTTGNRNIGLGRGAGANLTTGSDNVAVGNAGTAGESATIRIGTGGTQTRAFIAGIRGVTTGVANAIPLVIDSAGQLGTVSSSRRFKEDIQDMGAATRRLLELRPVVFRYRPEVQRGERPLEYGLIAEEVAEVFPELVVYDEEQKPLTVKYHLLSAMLLNELQELDARHETLEARVAALEARAAVAATGATR